MDKTKTPSLNAFCRGMADIFAINERLTGQPVPDALKRKLVFWKTGLFRIVVMGECKKGKSSFVNALLGCENLSPVCSDVATSTIFKICYGRKVSYRVFFSPNSGKEPLEVPQEQVSAFGTENGNPGNEKQVEFIQISCPAPLLKSGLVVIDTPGLGGLFKQHKRITYQYVPKSDAVFLVTDSISSPIGEAESALLEDLKKVTKHVYFIQTKRGLVDSEAAEARRKNNLAILERLGIAPDETRYFVVDSSFKHEADKTKDREMLEISGFDKVAAFLTQYLQPNVSKLVMENAILECSPIVDAANRILESRMRNLSVATEKDRVAILDEIKSVRTKLDDWDSKKRPAAQLAFDRKMLELNQMVSKRFEEFKPHGRLYSAIEERVDGAETTEALDSMISELNERLPQRFADATLDVIAFVKTETADAFGQFVESCGMKPESATFGDEDAVNAEVAVSPLSIRRRQSGRDPWDTARQIFYSASAGAMMGSVIPFVGTALGGGLGSAFGILGMVLGGRSLAVQELKTAKAQLKQDILLKFSDLFSRLTNDVSSVLQRIKLSLNFTMSEIVRQYRLELASREKDLEESFRKKSGERFRDNQELAALRTRLNAALASVGMGEIRRDV